MEFFTSDTHFGHRNIINYEERRKCFATVEEMDEAIIQRWNEQVSDGDTVYHLGDFGMSMKYANFKDKLERLNGHIVLVQGNHDDTKTVKRLAEEGYLTLHEVGFKMKVNKQVMWLTHYPMGIGERPNKWSIHGHIHSTPSAYKNQINVGLDSILIADQPFGKLWTMDEIENYMEKHEVNKEYDRTNLYEQRK